MIYMAAVSQGGTDSCAEDEIASDMDVDTEPVDLGELI